MVDSPDSIRHVLPKDARKIYLASFNNAWEEYKDAKNRRGDDTREEVAHKIAWAAVKQKYKKKGDKWKRK